MHYILANLAMSQGLAKSIQYIFGPKSCSPSYIKNPGDIAIKTGQNVFSITNHEKIHLITKWQK